jgi:hypothetical protein
VPDAAARSGGDAHVAAPTLRGALRSAASDLYYHSLRFLALNVLWGAGLIAAYLVALAWPLAGLILAVALALPTAGLYRAAALVARGEAVSLRDGLSAWRRFALPALAAGALLLLGFLVFGANLVSGLVAGDLPGIAFATLAGWGLIAVALLACCYWPLLTDPAHPERGGRGAARLATLLVLAHPVRIAALAFVLGTILALSTLMFAALVTISVAYCALVACRFVIPAAERLEAQLGARAAARMREEDRP